jgi:hypothetical protein
MMLENKYGLVKRFCGIAIDFATAASQNGVCITIILSYTDFVYNCYVIKD